MRVVTVPSSSPTLPPLAPRPLKVRRRPLLGLLGVVLVGLGALGVVFLVNSVSDTQRVLAVTSHVSPGEVIRAQDVTVIDVPQRGGVVTYVPESHLDDVVGSVAVVELLQGSVLAPEAFTGKFVVPKGRSLVGIQVAPNRRPNITFHAGDHIRIVYAPTEGLIIEEAEDGTILSSPSIDAIVVSATSSLTSEALILNVHTNASDATALGALVASGNIAIILDPPTGTTPPTTKTTTETTDEPETPTTETTEN